MMILLWVLNFRNLFGTRKFVRGRVACPYAMNDRAYSKTDTIKMDDGRIEGTHSMSFIHTRWSDWDEGRKSK